VTTIEASVLTPPDHARRYALVELFLVRVLDLEPADAPAEAEALQHAVSERLLGRIDALLGWPDRDLWGKRIPRPGGSPTSELASESWAQRTGRRPATSASEELA
jgi:Mn-dependent DtxR family transcriptional regulator